MFSVFDPSSRERTASRLGAFCQQETVNLTLRPMVEAAQADRRGPVRGLGEPQQAAWEYRKRYSHALLACVRVYSLNLPFVYVIIRTKLRRRIGICGGDTELLRRCFHEIS